MVTDKGEQVELTEQIFVYLDWLRETGLTNMYGATPYILAEFDFLEEKEAIEYLVKWMKTFAERHKK